MIKIYGADFSVSDLNLFVLVGGYVSLSVKSISKKKIRGQGMTEYIIIVALIAIAAIGVYTAFGNVIKGQTGAMAAELAGTDGQGAATKAGEYGVIANGRGSTKHDLGTFQDSAAEGRNK